MYKYWTILLVLLLNINDAHARWFKASSDNFVIYSDQSEKSVRNFAERLERYHSALLTMNATKPYKVSPSNRVTIFVLKDINAVKRLYGNRKSNVAGFYQSRAGGSVAFIPRIKGQSGSNISFSEVVFLHEYAHHFQLSNNNIALPRWYVEGYAEFFASASFEKNGSVWVGRPANHRASELIGNNVERIPLTTLLDTESYSQRKNKNGYDSFYGQSWQLFHYLTLAGFNKDHPRKDNMRSYLRNIYQGQEPIEAATNAFGDLEELTKDLKRYLKKNRISAFKLSPHFLAKTGEITVTQLSDGAVKIMPYLQKSRRGVSREQALALLDDAREVAKEYSNDEFVLAAMAEAEFDAGNDALAIQYADKSLALNPANMEAHVQKIYALFRTATDNEDEEQDAVHWKTLTRAIAAANRIENDHPIPLIYFYRSYEERNRKPSNIAVSGLEQVVALAPYDKTLTFMLIRQYMNDERYEDARRLLLPMRSDPHDIGFGEAAEKLLDEIGTIIAGKEDEEA